MTDEEMDFWYHDGYAKKPEPELDDNVLVKILLAVAAVLVVAGFYSDRLIKPNPNSTGCWSTTVGWGVCAK